MTGPQRRAQDPFTAALSDIFLPAVRPFGFDRRSARLIVRISDGILQLLNFQKSGYGGADFCVNYASMALFLPSEHIVLEPGGQPHWSAVSWADRVDGGLRRPTRVPTESMAEVLDAFHR